MSWGTTKIRKREEATEQVGLASIPKQEQSHFSPLYVAGFAATCMPKTPLR